MKKLLQSLILVAIMVSWVTAQTVDFDTQVQPIFTSNCVGCHTSSHPTGLNLTTGNSYDLLVDVESANYSPALRVVSGDASTSVLYNKIANTGVHGGIMPPSGGPLSAGDIETIQTWINELGMVQEMTIAEARALEEGAEAAIRGVVTSPNFGTAGSYTEVTIQDPTGGIVIFSNTFDAGLAVGDSVAVTGSISIYNGKVELVPSSPVDIETVSTGNTLPAFQALTLAEYVANFNDYESELLVFDSVSIIGGTWPAAGSNANITITDPSEQNATMRIDKETDI
ncbi:MAG: hypothetical protein K9N36_09635, partial [Candidatus Marinimicrobia bacterium]|nr:hypothetical protein [Candidatus Neomarinimicrobiota bacterium]